MEQSILLNLQHIGFNIEQKSLSQSLEEGPKNILFTQTVHYLTNELRSLCNIDEEVNTITSPEDSVSFLMEFSSFLKELGCPYESLVQGPISDRLSTKDEKTLAINYLISELMGARMVQEKIPSKKIELKLRESPEALNLKKMLITLRFPKPSIDITSKTLFEKLNPTIENLIKKTGGVLPGHPIFAMTLEEDHWQVLEGVQKDLHDEYLIRREMLLKRLDCTIDSLQWSDKMKHKGEQIMDTYTAQRKSLKVEPNIDLSDLISAREDLAIIEKTSSSSVRKNTKSTVNQVIIGQVPDRGGRTSEQAAPPPEMPSWQQRQAPQGGGRGRGGFRGRGDYQRGGFSGGKRGGGGGGGGGSNCQGQQQQQNRQSEYQQQQNKPFDSAGSYNNSYQNHNNYQQPYGQGGNYSNQGGNYSNQGNQGGSEAYGYQNEAKRPKTYDSFQQNSRTSQADQYVQESQQNQRWQRNSGGGGGRGSRRGNRNNYY